MRLIKNLKWSKRQGRYIIKRRQTLFVRGVILPFTCVQFTRMMNLMYITDNDKQQQQDKQPLIADNY